MKKLITLILILTIVFPVLSYGEDTELIGKWSFYIDPTNWSQDLRDAFAYDLVVYDLYLFKNNAAYLTKVDIKKGSKKPDFSYGALSGLWIGDSDDITIMIADTTYKAKLSDDGFLLFYLSENLPFPMVKIDTTDRLYEELVP